LCGSVLLMAVLLGVRPDLWEATRLPMFWVKIGFPAVLAAVALVAVLRLSRPGLKLNRVPAALAAPVVAMWLIAVAALTGAASEAREALIFGDTWTECLVNISVLAAPLLVALAWAMKEAAPTRPALAGGAGGLLAGALAAVVYALHCPEMAAPFIGIWYLLGMLIPAAVGAAIGAKVLRW
jgi:hypothetical protein